MNFSAVTSENAKQENVNVLQVSSQEMKQSGNSIVLSSAANRLVLLNVM